MDHKFVMETVGCGIGHKETKATHKNSTVPQTNTFLKIHKKGFDIKYTHIMQGPYNKQGKKGFEEKKRLLFAEYPNNIRVQMMSSSLCNFLHSITSA
jgi:hypothetical protein